MSNPIFNLTIRSIKCRIKIMTKAIDVANHIVFLAEKFGETVTNMKLQKLTYYAYAWFLVEKSNREALFNEDIEAWQYGPVIPCVYDQFKSYGADAIKNPSSDEIQLNDIEKQIIEDVFKIYGQKNAIELMEMTHNEAPWRESYEEGKNNSISRALIFNFYSSVRNNLQNA